MKTITDKEISAALNLFKWLVPHINESPIDWLKVGKENANSRFYKYEKDRVVHALWINLPNINEAQFVRIAKKINNLPHEFFLYHYEKVTRLGWRINNQIKV